MLKNNNNNYRGEISAVHQFGMHIQIILRKKTYKELQNKNHEIIFSLSKCLAVMQSIMFGEKETFQL